MTYAIRKSGGGSPNANGTSVPGGGTVYQFPQYISDGSAAAPELSFVNDQSKGLYATASGLGVATGGTQRVFVDNSGNVTLSGGLNVTGAVALSGLITLSAGSTIANTTAANPNGTTTASPGSLVVSTTGGANRTVWAKESGFGNTGWTPFGQPTIVATFTTTVTVGLCVNVTETSPGVFSAAPVNLTTLDAAPASGIVTTVDGNTCVVAFGGVAEGVAANLTTGKTVFVGPSGVATTNPAALTAPYFVQAVGVAVSTTSVLVLVRPISLYRAA